MRFGSQILGILIIFAALTASAWVDETNANFVLSRVDHRVVTGPVELVLQRTYNSVSVNDGLFGHGWCSTFETSLTVVSSQQIVVQECGEGKASVLTRPSLDLQVQKSALDEIMKAAQAKLTNLPKDFRVVLESDVTFRARMVRQLGVQFDVAENTSFVSTAKERATFKAGHFVRTRGKSETDVFSKKGWLESVSSGAAKIAFDYDKGNLRSISDSKGNRLYMRRSNEGRVVAITAPKGAVTKYEYSLSGDLLKVTSPSGNEEYTYDADHNMTTAQKGEVVVRLKYDSINDRVTEVAYGDCRESYGYEVKSGVNDWFAVNRVLSCKGSPPSKTRSEYKYALRGDGLSLKADEVYIDANGGKTETRFDDRGRLVSRESPTMKAVVTYSSEGRVSRYASAKSVFDYTYARDGRLTEAKLASGSKISYSFDEKGRLEKMRDSRGRTLVLDYEGASPKAKSVHVPGQIVVPLETGLKGGPSIPRSPASLQDMTATLTLYDELYTPAIPALLGGRNAR